MTWRTGVERLALLELLVQGTLKRRRAQEAAWEVLAELPWTRLTGRRGELKLVAEHRHELVRLLDRVWPTWSDALAALTARGLAATPEGWKELEDKLRAVGLSQLPDRLNRRTAAALVAPHSKAVLTGRRLDALGDTVTTHDGSIRMRPPQGLVASTPAGKVDLSAVASVFGEASIPERAFGAGLTFEGSMRAVLLIENLGVFCDLPSLDGWLLVHVPGWDTATVARLLERLGHVPVIHFGDLDPNGVRIFQHLRGLRSDLRWFVPGFWKEFLEERGLPGVWPEDLEFSEAPSLVHDVSARGLWLEQEFLALDPRTLKALEAML
jgi:hypothetical protein